MHTNTHTKFFFSKRICVWRCGFVCTHKYSKIALKTWEMTCKYANEYYLRLLCVPLCTAFSLLHHHRHNYAILLSLLSKPSHHHQQQHNNSVYIHSRKLRISISILVQSTQTHSCIMPILWTKPNFHGIFPYSSHIRIRIICLFTLNPSSCMYVYLAWFKIETLFICTNFYLYFVQFCLNNIQHHWSRTFTHTQIMLLNSMPIFPISFFLSHIFLAFSNNI